jgi:hypothetical protein
VGDEGEAAAGIFGEVEYKGFYSRLIWIFVFGE